MIVVTVIAADIAVDQDPETEEDVLLQDLEGITETQTGRGQEAEELLATENIPGTEVERNKHCNQAFFKDSSSRNKAKPEFHQEKSRLIIIKQKRENPRFAMPHQWNEQWPH